MWLWSIVLQQMGAKELFKPNGEEGERFNGILVRFNEKAMLKLVSQALLFDWAVPISRANQYCS